MFVLKLSGIQNEFLTSFDFSYIKLCKYLKFKKKVHPVLKYVDYLFSKQNFYAKLCKRMFAIFYHTYKLNDNLCV